MQIVYVLGLGRSGTTALNLLLGLDERLLCLGSMPHSSAELEVKVKRNIRCSCGDSVSDCVFWARFNGLVDSSDGDFCVEVMRRAADLEGVEVLVDASKSIDRLTHWIDVANSNPDIELKIVNLVRDVRGYTQSITNRANSSISRIPKVLRKFVYPFWIPFQWARAVRTHREFLESNDYVAIRLSYESMCFETAEFLDQLYRVIGLSVPEVDSDLRKSYAHDSSEKSLMFKRTGVIKFDYKWFLYPFKSSLYLFIPQALREMSLMHRDDGVWGLKNFLECSDSNLKDGKLDDR